MNTEKKGGNVLFERKGSIVARKQHECQYCKTPIYKGTTYYNQSYFDRDDHVWVRYKLHLECKDLFFVAQDNLEKYYYHWEQWYEEVFI